MTSLTRNANIQHVLTSNEQSAQCLQEQVSALSPLIRQSKRQRSYAEIDAVAKRLGKSRVTIYRWLKKIGNNSHNSPVTALLKDKREDFGQSRLHSKVDAIINDQIHQFHLAQEQPSVAALCKQIKFACLTANMTPPSSATIRRRVHRVQDNPIQAKNDRNEQIDDAAHRGKFPFVAYQIDHIPMNMGIMNELSKRDIGFPYLTLVIDTCTRMVAGFCITYDHCLSDSAAGLAMANAILPKQACLAQFEMDVDWPIYGTPQTLYTECDSKTSMLASACKEYDIALSCKPKTLPNEGKRILRLFRTWLEQNQQCPQVTFLNEAPIEKAHTENDVMATLAELEQWLVFFITQVYHHKTHQDLGGNSPFQVFERFILGDESNIGIGLPNPILNERQLRLDFMPYAMLPIHRDGVCFDGLYYDADVTRLWSRARDENNVKLKRQFKFARDPRDMSVIYFFNPETKQYDDVPYKNPIHPSMSV